MKGIKSPSRDLGSGFGEHLLDPICAAVRTCNEQLLLSVTFIWIFDRTINTGSITRRQVFIARKIVTFIYIIFNESSWKYELSPCFALYSVLLNSDHRNRAFRPLCIISVDRGFISSQQWSVLIISDMLSLIWLSLPYTKQEVGSAHPIDVSFFLSGKYNGWPQHRIFIICHFSYLYLVYSLVIFFPESCSVFFPFLLY